MGSHVTLVARGRLLTREDPRVSELIRDALSADDIDLRLGRQVRRVTPHGSGTRVELGDGASVDVDVVVLGTGRRPRTAGLCQETAGVHVGGSDGAVSR